MLHLNSELKKTPFFWLESFLPEYYSASSVTDYMDNASEMKTTKKILPLGVFFNQEFFIDFPFLVFESLHIFSDYATFSDMNGSFDSSIRMLNDKQLKNLKIGKTIYNPSFIYNGADFPSNYKQLGFNLFYFSISPPSSGKKNKKKGLFEKLGLKGVLSPVPLHC